MNGIWNLGIVKLVSDVLKINFVMFFHLCDFNFNIVPMIDFEFMNFCSMCRYKLADLAFNVKSFTLNYYFDYRSHFAYKSHLACKIFNLNFDSLFEFFNAFLNNLFAYLRFDLLISYYDFIIKHYFTLDSFVIVAFLFIIGVLIFANYFDLKFGIIPNRLSLVLFLFGFILNCILSVFFKNVYFLLFALMFSGFVFIVSLILWKIGFWGGGDVKLYSAMAFALSFLYKDFVFDLPNSNYLIGKYLSSNILSDLAILNQNTFYPLVFSILINAILISAPIILFILMCRILKSSDFHSFDYFKTRYHDGDSIISKLTLFPDYLCFIFPFMIFNFIPLIKQSSIKSLNLVDLKEGMILYNYYFDNIEVFNKINTSLTVDYNLMAFKITDNSNNGGFNNSSNESNKNAGNLSNISNLNKKSNHVNMPNLNKNNRINMPNLHNSNLSIQSNWNNKLNSDSNKRTNLKNKVNSLINYNKNNFNYYLTDRNSFKGFYFKSSTAGGLTKKDLDLIHELYENNLINYPKFDVKLGIPFLPSLTIGFLFMLIYGDLIYIISHFLNHLLFSVL